MATKKLFFVYVLIRPTSLVLKEHFFCILSVLTRLVRLISAKTIAFFLAVIYAIGLYIYQLTISSCVSVRMSRYWARGKFGEHERGVRVARGAAECNSSLLSC